MKAYNFIDLLRRMRSTVGSLHVLTYEMAMKYYKTDAPADYKVVRGIMLRRTLPKKIHIMQFFIDEEDNIINQPGYEDRVYGRQLFVTQLDAELTELFDDSDMIIIE